MNGLSFQLYSARDHGPWTAVFERIAALGYTGVEGYAALYDDPEALARELAAFSLAMPTAHLAVEALEDEPERAFATARTLGVTTIFAPYLAPDARPSTLDDWRAFAARLRRIGERVNGEGFGFGWHNHDFELRPLADGTVPLDVVLDGAPEIDWEADLAWIVRADADPLAWVTARAERITAVHLKDVAADDSPTTPDEEGWADPGHGSMDWAALLAALRSSKRPRHWIVEHDAPSDLDRFARRAMASWRGWTEDGEGASA